jgi:hypothetical protein
VKVSAKLEVDEERSRMQRKVLTKLRASVRASTSVQRELDQLLDEAREAVWEVPPDLLRGLDGAAPGHSAQAAAPVDRVAPVGCVGLDPMGDAGRAGLAAGHGCIGVAPHAAPPEEALDLLGGSPPQILGAVAIIRARSAETAQRIQALGARTVKHLLAVLGANADYGCEPHSPSPRALALTHIIGGAFTLHSHRRASMRSGDPLPGTL